MGPAVGLPRGIKIPSAAELFNGCLSAVTARAGPWRALETQAAELAAWEAGDRGALSLQGESPPLACCWASEPGWAGARSLSLIPLPPAQGPGTLDGPTRTKLGGWVMSSPWSRVSAPTICLLISPEPSSTTRIPRPRVLVLGSCSH